MPRTLYAEFTVTPGNEARVAEMMRELTALVRAEPGNIVFDPYTEQARLHRYFVLEAYADDAAFEAHINADYGARFNAELATLIAEDASQLTWLRPLRPPINSRASPRARRSAVQRRGGSSPLPRWISGVSRMRRRAGPS